MARYQMATCSQVSCLTIQNLNYLELKNWVRDIQCIKFKNLNYFKLKRHFSLKLKLKCPYLNLLPHSSDFSDCPKSSSNSLDFGQCSKFKPFDNQTFYHLYTVTTLNTGLVWYANGRFVSGCQMVPPVFKWWSEIQTEKACIWFEMSGIQMVCQVT